MVTGPTDARRAGKLGVDFIVEQGGEAGGHLKWGAGTLVANCIQTDSLAGR
jgi:NAD(P)H-dependent flavin oxidoreductase YrpB (nitropropane dioxygenase family)